MKPFEIALICIACTILCTSIIVISCFCVFKKKVIQNSKIYNALIELNQKYKFHYISSVHNYIHACNSKRQLDNYNFSKALKNIVEASLHNFTKLRQNVNENIKLFKSYTAACATLHDENKLSVKEIKNFKVPCGYWYKTEERLYQKNLLTPTTSFTVHIRATYTSPQGRNSYYSERQFSDKSVFDLINLIEEEKQKQIELEQYKKAMEEERERKKELRTIQQAERNKLTKKLRYEILERDHYKCAICGRSANDGIILHVDHIIPISKGGETIPSNLQTLCEDCNLGKSDKLPNQSAG